MVWYSRCCIKAVWYGIYAVWTLTMLVHYHSIALIYRDRPLLRCLYSKSSSHRRSPNFLYCIICTLSVAHGIVWAMKSRHLKMGCMMQWVWSISIKILLTVVDVALTMQCIGFYGEYHPLGFSLEAITCVGKLTMHYPILWGPNSVFKL